MSNFAPTDDGFLKNPEGADLYGLETKKKSNVENHNKISLSLGFNILLLNPHYDRAAAII
jgi:hypothetical protein